MTNVLQWLESLGLGQYRKAFADNAIDASALRDLTERDLKELGVVPVDHRNKLLRAIEQLREVVPRPLDPSTTAPAQEDDERRQLTALFCDLVGSATLAARLDPEDMRKVIDSYHDCVTEVITKHDGDVDAPPIGDGRLALFGHPNAHEDDAEQAIRAGLALVDAVANLQTAAPARLQARVGIATGTVVVRHQPGRASAHKQRVVGAPPNLAERLQALAAPGTVVICANTRPLTEGLFDCRDLGERSVKGWEEPVRAWQVLGPSGVESRFDARHKSRLAPLLGREEEMELLLRRWKSAVVREGRVVILIGEPGIGKSHIVLALQDRLEAELHSRLRYYCSAHHTNSALFPFISQLERAARFERSDSNAEKLAKLAGLFPAASCGDDTLALMADLLSLPTTERDRIQELSPQMRKERTLAVLLAQLDALAARQPVLMIVEDAHWIDPTSLEMLTVLVERVPKLPIVLVITARTRDGQAEFKPPWASHSHVKTIVLNYLGRRDSEALATWVAEGKALPKEVMTEILGRAEGVPLYVEEYTKAVLESGQLDERGGRYVVNRPLPSLAIPTTLRASLMERLDRLREARDTALTGAVVGREFSYELLDAVPGPHRHNLATALGELVRSELVFQRGEIPHAVYRFKHALLRDEAYAGLVRGRRVALHAAIASAFEEKFPEIVAAEPETLGDHFSKAGLPRQAIPYWLLAGKNAAGRFANLEAIAHLGKGIEEAGALPEHPERDRLELDLTIELAPCLIATQGPGSHQSLTTSSRARDLCERLGDAPEYPQVLFWVASADVVRGNSSTP